MKTVCTIEKDGKYLMNTQNGFLEWTDEWQQALLYANKPFAVSDKDYMGLSLARVVEYDLIPPVPVQGVLTSTVVDETSYVYIISEKHADPLKHTFCTIRHSNKPIADLQELQKGYGNELVLQGWFQVPDKTTGTQECKALQATFAHLQLQANSEWLFFNDELKGFILDSEKHNKNFTRYC